MWYFFDANVDKEVMNNFIIMERIWFSQFSDELDTIFKRVLIHTMRDFVLDGISPTMTDAESIASRISSTFFSLIGDFTFISDEWMDLYDHLYAEKDDKEEDD